jgi:hypothetical protein
MKKLRQMLAGIMILIVGLSCMVSNSTILSYAASTNFTISLSSSSIKKGDSVTVTVTLSCSETLGAYSYCLSYDSSILEYSSGSGYGGGGTISYAGYGDGSATSASASYTFTAIGTGSASISTNSSDVYTWNEDTCSVSNAGVTVTVGAVEKATEAPATEAPSSEKPASSEASSENNSEEATEAATEASTEETTEEISDNCFLSSLEITPGELDPEFAKETYTYNITVPGETTSLTINAIPEDSKSTVAIDGNSDFEPGKTAHITITVTAETGDKHIYDLLVECEEIIDTRVIINVEGTDMYFSQDYSHINIPEGFSETQEALNDGEAILYISPNGLIKCAYLTDEEGKNGGWYIIDTENMTAVPMIQATSAYNYYIILTPDETVSIPAGYEPFTFEITNGNNITAYKKEGNEEIFLVYAMNPSTSAGWYLYDSQELTFMRYIEDTTVDTAIAEENNENFFDKHKNTIIITALIIMLLMIITVIVLGCIIATMAKEKTDEDVEDDEEDSIKRNPYNILVDNTNDNISDTNVRDSKENPIEADIKTASVKAGSDVPVESQADESQSEESLIDEIEADESLLDKIKLDESQPEEGPVEEGIVEASPASEKTANEGHPDDMTEFKQEAPVDNSNSNFEAHFNKPSEEDDIIKAAAKYSSLNTADLSEVINMAADIVNHEGTDTTPAKDAEKKEASGIQFKAIKAQVHNENETNDTDK